MTELLNCPFCGSAPKVKRDVHVSNNNIHINWLILCDTCGRARTSGYPTEYKVTDEETLEKIPFGAPYRLRDGRKTAIEEWNTRAAEKPSEEPAEPSTDVPSTEPEAGNETGNT